MAYWEPADPKFGTTGVGCIFSARASRMYIAKEHLFSQFSLKANSTFTYLSGAAWDRAGEITNAQSWYSYLNEKKNKMSTKVKATIF